jgi:hypothetical protein
MQQRRQAGETKQGDAFMSASASKKDPNLGGRTTIRNVKKRSIIFVRAAGSRLSSGTASALTARKRTAKRSIQPTERDVLTSYVHDTANAPPIPPLPAYQPAASVELRNVVDDTHHARLIHAEVARPYSSDGRTI